MKQQWQLKDRVRSDIGAAQVQCLIKLERTSRTGADQVQRLSSTGSDKVHGQVM